MFEDWIDGVATALGSSTVNAGIFMALMFTTAFILIMVVATRGKNMLISLVTSIMLVILFTMMQWLPTWTGGALALALSFLSAIVLSRTSGD